jgi:hypothetical protein
VTWHIESAHGTWLAAGYATREEADSALGVLRSFVAEDADSIPEAERALAENASVVEDFDWGPFRLRLYRGVT